MTSVTELSESQLKDRVDAEINLVNSTTNLSGETVNRPVDSDDIMELQQSKLNSISNHSTYVIKPSENIATFTFTIRDSNLERTISRRERNANFPDEVSAEFVIGREVSWIASTINNGQHLRRNIGYVSHNDYSVEIVSKEKSTVVNIVFTGSQK